MGNCMSAGTGLRGTYAQPEHVIRDNIPTVLGIPSKRRHDPFEGKWFKKRGKIGVGVYCDVWRCRDLRPGEDPDVDVIIKVFNLDKFDKFDILQLQREILIQKLLHSKSPEHFPSVIELFSSEDKKKIFMVEEYAVGGDLFDYISTLDSLSEEGCVLLFKCILEAVVVMHDQGISHRDLKPENIFLLSKNDPNSIIVGDFGQSHSNNPKISGAAPWVNPSQMDTIVGTIDYMAPEMVKNQKGELDAFYTTHVDEWACGCIFYLCLVGNLPFSLDDKGQEMSHHMIFQAILAAKVTFPEDLKLSQKAIDLITLLLEPIPERRITAKEALELQFFNERPARPPELTDDAIQRRKESLNMTIDNLKKKRRNSINLMRRNSLNKSSRRTSRSGSISEFAASHGDDEKSPALEKRTSKKGSIMEFLARKATMDLEEALGNSESNDTKV